MSLLIKANNLLLRKEYTEAFALYEQYLEEFPDRYQLLESKLAIIEAETGKKVSFAHAARKEIPDITPIDSERTGSAPQLSKIDALYELASLTRGAIIENENLGLQKPGLRWLADEYIPELFSRFRNTKPRPIINSNASQSAESSNAVSVIVPVYKGYEETVACISSVLNSRNETSYRLIVINDSSPEEQISSYLHEQSSHGRIHLVENESNQGFVKSANRGMALFASEDVILLNSDTEVPDRWIDKLHRHAYSESTIGTVTPFSNNAEICSFPLICAENELENWLTLNEYQAFFEENCRSVRTDLPTAVGFCMYIKRPLLDLTGYFDEEKYGRGYGEENDLSVKARMLGWSNSCCTELFVKHVGSVSFSKDTEEMKSKHLGLLLQDYPEYSNQVGQFLSNDPLRLIRNAIAKSLLKSLIAKRQYRKKFYFLLSFHGRWNSGLHG